MADEKIIIKNIQTAVEGLSGSFKILDEVLSKNMGNQKKLIANLEAIKKNLAGTKSLKQFVTLQKKMNDEQLRLNKTQQAAIDLSKKNEQRKQQVIKTQQAAVAATKKEQLANEKLKQSKMRTAKAERSANEQKEKATKASKEASRAYNIESKRLLKLTKDVKDAAVKYGMNSKQVRRLTKEQQKLDRQLKKVDASVGQHTRNVGNYKSAWGGVKNAIVGAAGFMGAMSLATRAIGKIGTELKKSSKIQDKLRQQYRLTGKELENIAAQVQVISNVYEKDYNEVISAANSISKEFGITAEESLNIINEGFEKGADNSGEFLSMLKEYPAQLKSVGLNADQSIAIMTQSVKEGIFSDKGVDAIKEAGIRLRELTPATREALDQIGLSSREIEQSLRDGSKSLFDVIQEVSQRLKQLPPESREVGTALADIFGGAGEDAGIRYISMLGDVSMSLDDVKSNTDPYIQSQMDLSKAWTKTILGMQGANGLATEFNKMLITILQNLNSIFGERTFDIDITGFIPEAKKKADEELKQTKSVIEKRLGEINDIYTENQMVAATGIKTWQQRMAFMLKPDIWGVLPEGFSGNMLKELKKIQKSGEEYAELKQKLTIVTKILNGEEIEEEDGKKKLIVTTGDEKVALTDLIEIQQELLSQAKEMPGATEPQIAVRNRKVKAIENEIARLKELGQIQQVEAFDMQNTLSSYEESYKTMEEMDQEYLDGYLDKEQQKTDAIREQEERRKELRRQTEEEIYNLGKALGNAYFETKAEQYKDEREANQKHYDKLLANEKLTQEQRDLLEAKRQKKDNEIREKERENERNQFLFEQSVAIGKIWMATAVNIAKHPLLAPIYTSIAAIQTGIVAVQTIPQLDKGTESTPETYIAGEKRSEIRVDKKGKAEVIDKPTLFQDDPGAKIIGGADTSKLMDSVSNYTNSQIVNNGDKVTGQDALIGKLVSRMIDENSKGNKSIIKELQKNRPKQARETTIDKMRTDNLKNRLRN
ncbi:MAG: phage tail tape measure protein [Kiritimatiellae bacterium]|jgi:hypothetical protein|nr:phage tail tape measure protein [Kiritimatiellia bacterium]